MGGRLSGVHPASRTIAGEPTLAGGEQTLAGGEQTLTAARPADASP
jgi:hypothetical protein